VIKIGKVRFVFYFLGSALLFFVGRRFVVSASNVAGYYASYITYPILVAQNKIVVPVRSFFQYRKSIKELTQENECLREKNESLLAEFNALKAQMHYLGDVRELVEFKKRYDPEIAILGQILFKQFSDENHYFFVNKGSSHGIKPDMIALYNNCLIGRVSDVYPWYCKIIAVTDKSCKIAVYCEKSASCGIHQGSCELDRTLLKRISHLSTVYEDELVLSSGEGLIFPRGFALGRIKTVSTEHLWHQITIDPLVSLKSLSHCLLIHKAVVS